MKDYRNGGIGVSPELRAMEERGAGGRKRVTLALARAAYDALSDIVDVGRVYEAALAGEKRHRRGDFARYHPGAASAPRCAELFTARWLAEYALNPDKIPGIAAVLRLRPDAYLAAAIVQRDGPDAILAVLHRAKLDPVAVAALDYMQVVN